MYVCFLTLSSTCIKLLDGIIEQRRILRKRTMEICHDGQHRRPSWSLTVGNQGDTEACEDKNFVKTGAGCKM